MGLRYTSFSTASLNADEMLLSIYSVATALLCFMSIGFTTPDIYAVKNENSVKNTKIKAKNFVFFLKIKSPPIRNRICGAILYG